MTVRLFLFLLTLTFSFLVRAQNGSPRKVLVENFRDGGYGDSSKARRILDTVNANSAKTILINYTTPFCEWSHRNAWIDVCYPDSTTKYLKGPYQCVYSDCQWGFFVNGRRYQVRYMGDTLTRVQIDSASAFVSSFEVNTAHSFNFAHDSMYIDTEIICTKDLQGQDLRLWMLPMQKYMDYQEHAPLTVPTMGLGEYHNVCWQVGPDTGALDIPNVWSIGQRLSFRYSWPISKVFDKEQLYAVSFIQDFASKEVLQAAESQPYPLSLPRLGFREATIWDEDNLCNTGFLPRVVFENLGQDTIREIKISYTLNWNPVIGIWRGVLAPGDSDGFIFPRTNFSLRDFAFLGSYAAFLEFNNILKYNLLSVDGRKDMTPFDDQTPSRQIIRLNFLTDIDTLYNTTGWGAFFIKYKPTSLSWFASQGSQQYFMSVFNEEDVWEDSRIEAYPKKGVSLFGRDSTTSIEFVYAATGAFYKYMNGSVLVRSDSTKTDTFALQATTDCGLNWTTLWQKSGRELMTTSFSDTSDLAERHWRTVKASLAPVVGRIAHFRFVNLSHGMAQVYLDDIRIRPVPVVPPHTYVPTPYPNPTNGLLHLDLEFAGAGNSVQTSMFDALGRQVIGEVRHTLPAGLSTLAVDMSVLGNGYYYLVVGMPDGSRKSWPVIKL